MTSKILHITQQLSLGGAGRAILYLGSYSKRLGPYTHSVLSLIPADPAAKELAGKLQVPVFDGGAGAEQLIADADIIQISWWNNLEVNRLLRSALPAARLMGWFHCGGQAAPHIISDKLARFFDCAAACSPYTLRCPALKRYAADFPHAVTMILGATDFARLDGRHATAHEGFNVGYIGTLDFVKMHPEYVAMSAGAAVPDARFIVCGSGSALPTLAAQARRTANPQQFDFKGQVEDVAAILAALDVYGYPLCPDTYAASELNLQEAMYMGVPPVVFPYGGVQDLVQHNETALVVNSPAEYSAAIRYLRENPEQRRRIGHNAKAYAAAHFGARNAALAANGCYDAMMKEPKRLRSWPEQLECATVEGIDQSSLASDPGARLFIDTLGSAGAPFLRSICARDALEALKADVEISASAPNLAQGGIGYYRIMFQQSPYLTYWTGLTHLAAGSASSALELMALALQLGLDNWRLITALFFAARAAGNNELALKAGQLLTTAHLPRLPAELSSVLMNSGGWHEVMQQVHRNPGSRSGN